MQFRIYNQASVPPEVPMQQQAWQQSLAGANKKQVKNLYKYFVLAKGTAIIKPK